MFSTRATQFNDIPSPEGCDAAFPPERLPIGRRGGSTRDERRTFRIPMLINDTPVFWQAQAVAYFKAAPFFQRFEVFLKEAEG